MVKRQQEYTLWRFNTRGKVLKQASLFHDLVIDGDGKSLIRLDNKGVQTSLFLKLARGGRVHVLFLPLLGDWVLVSEDKVDLVAGTALVWAKPGALAAWRPKSIHDGVGGLVGVFFRLEGGVICQDLDVCAYIHLKERARECVSERKGKTYHHSRDSFGT